MFTQFADGKDNPLPLLSNFGIKAASLKRIYRSHKTEAQNSEFSTEASIEQKAALTVLDRLRYRQRARGIESVYGLKLWQVDLNLQSGKIVRQGPRLLGEIPAEDL